MWNFWIVLIFIIIHFSNFVYFYKGFEVNITFFREGWVSTPKFFTERSLIMVELK